MSAWHVFQEPAYECLADISVTHLYNLRASADYKRQRVFLDKTKPTKANIGKRKKPRPNGIPGYLRIDTVIREIITKQKAYTT